MFTFPSSGEWIPEAAGELPANRMRRFADDRSLIQNPCAFDMPHFAENVRRLMARKGMTMRELVVASGLHECTVKAALGGTGKPQARTLHRLAAGLGVSSDELFQNPAALSIRTFDQQTNPAVDEVVAQHPELFEDWSTLDFEELYSHFGIGGALSSEGAVEMAQTINEKKAIHRKVALLLESGEAVLLRGFIDLLYQKIAVTKV